MNSNSSQLCYQGLLFFLVATVAILLISDKTNGQNVYDWLGYDKFDEIDDRMNVVNAENCQTKSASQLRLPADTIAQAPMFNRLLSYIVYPNRTNLLHTHNMALNRAFFYSYIFQKLNQTYEFNMQPGWMYFYLSVIADVTANPNINGSGIFYDTKLTYAHWFKTLPWNRTIPLFGPFAFREDDYNEPTNWIREPTNHTVQANDLGAGSQNNYTLKSYKINQFYDLFLPDGWANQGQDSLKKFQYSIGIKYSNQTGKFETDFYKPFTLFGPPFPGQKDATHLPVLFTEPYFDCGKSNRWIVSAVAPVVDHIPRYLDWFHLRRMTYVAVTIMNMEFLSVDFNPCPFSIGQQPPNYLNNIARCKPSTICEPLYGWGFRRGGYHCMCKPGYRYPPWQMGPFLGIEIESATELEYKNGFNCVPVEFRQVIPVFRSNDTQGTPIFNVGFGKRNVDSVLDIKAIELSINDKNVEDEEASINDEVEYFESLHTRPKMARKTDRAIKRGPEDVKQSRILNKKLRLLRLMNLNEIAKKKDPSCTKKCHKKMKVVPRVSHPYHLQNKTNKKIEFVPRHDSKSIKLRKLRRQAFDENQYNRMQRILNFKTSINGENCKKYRKDELFLPGDVGYNVDVIFSNQARTALRLSHFLSNFLQNVDMYEEYGNLRVDKLLNIEQLFGEVLANTMGDLKLKGSGIFYDLNKYKDPNGSIRELFGPYAYRFEKPPVPSSPTSDVANTNFRAVDYAGYLNSYLDEPWFKNIKERWQSNTYGLTKFREKIKIRSDENGTNQVNIFLYPMYFQAPKVEDGMWSAPYFNCYEEINDWLVTYSVPFFGLNSVGTNIEFKGVVTVDVKLDELDINQCPQDYFVPNAFKDTARCHYETTYCVYLAGKRFVRGAYKCECKVGYEYPFIDNQWYFDGQTMEEEYRKKIVGDKQSRYNNLNCRISVSSHLSQPSILMMMTLFIMILQLSRTFGVLPSTWKTALVIPIPKKDKPPSEISSYRPISLSSTLCKVMERIIANRLRWFLESNCLLDPHQAGFRNNRSCRDQITKISYEIASSSSGKDKTMAVFLDLEKAFDIVWRDGLIDRLNKMSIKGKILRWIQDFLRNRLIKVRLGGTTSGTYSLDNGNPQGSILSPLLFILMLNDLPSPTKGIKLSIYADDIAFWTCGKEMYSKNILKITNILHYIVNPFWVGLQKRWV